MKKILISTLITSSLVVAISAQDKLTAHAELGYIDTQGNTKTQTFNLDSEIKKNFDKHMFTLTLDSQYATTDKTETKNKYKAEASYDYAYTDRLSFGYLLGFKQDEFSGFDYQLYTGPTLKYQAIKEEAHNLALGLSILYAQDKIENINGTDGYAAYGADLVYAWQINEDLKFGQDLGYRSEFEDAKNYFVTSKTSLVSKISDIFSAGISYKVDYANTPPASKIHTDRTFTVNLIMDY